MRSCTNFCFKMYEIGWSLLFVSSCFTCKRVQSKRARWLFQKTKESCVIAKCWGFSVLAKQCWFKVLKACSWARLVPCFSFTSTEQYTHISVNIKVLLLHSAVFPFFLTCSSKEKYLCLRKLSLFNVRLFKRDVCIDLLRKDTVQRAADHCLVQLVCVSPHAPLSLAAERSARFVCWGITHTLLYLRRHTTLQRWRIRLLSCSHFSAQCRVTHTSTGLAGSCLADLW